LYQNNIKLKSKPVLPCKICVQNEKAFQKLKKLLKPYVYWEIPIETVTLASLASASIAKRAIPEILERPKKIHS